MLERLLLLLLNRTHIKSMHFLNLKPNKLSEHIIKKNLNRLTTHNKSRQFVVEAILDSRQQFHPSVSVFLLPHYNFYNLRISVGPQSVTRQGNKAMRHYDGCHDGSELS